MGRTDFQNFIDGKDDMCTDEPMSATVIKRMRQGTYLEGERKALVTEDGHYFSFKGIPYAKPPVGALRFKAPEPPALWEGIRKATHHTPVCPQKKVHCMECQEITGSEDCLYLNVYTPDMEPRILLPVMVYIHGGGLWYGSADDTNYGPDFLVRKGVVLVTFNYRLNTLGFLCLDTAEVPGNAGLKDQVAALRWVQNHIVDFGGDPKNVTIFGESAAGVALHVVSPMSAGLFKRVILLGGIPMCDWTMDASPRHRAVTLAYLLGLEDEEPDSDKLLKFLRSVSVENMVTRAPCLFRSEDMHNFILNMSHFTCVIEKDFGQERFLAEDPEETIKKQNINKVDVMVGYANSSASDRLHLIENAIEIYRKAPELFVPRRILRDASKDKILNISNRIRDYYFGEKPTSSITIKEFVKYMSDSCCLLGTYRFIRHLSYIYLGIPAIYFFRFCGVSERSFRGREAREKHGIQGASHTDMIMHLFDPKSIKLKIDHKSKGFQLMDLMCNFTTNFAKMGKPFEDDCYSDTVWCEYDYFGESYMDIDEALTPGTALNDEVVDFWKSLYEYAEVSMSM